METSIEQLGTTVASAELNRVPRCAPGDPVLAREHRVADAMRHAIEWCDCVQRADRFSYCIELRRIE